MFETLCSAWVFLQNLILLNLQLGKIFVTGIPFEGVLCLKC